MLAARNQRFRIAAACGAAAYLIGTAGGIIYANYLSGFSLPTGEVISSVIIPAASLVGACGWVVIALAFGPQIDWKRLRLGGTILATVLCADSAAAILRLASRFPSTHPERVSSTLGTLTIVLTAAAAVVVVTGLAESRWGEARVRRLRLGAASLVAANICATAAGLFLESYFSRLGAAHEVTISAYIAAAGSFGLAASAFVIFRAFERPFGRREAILVGAAVVGLVATLVAAGSEVLLATALPDLPGSDLSASIWFGAANRIVFAGVFLFVALGAHTATAPEPTVPIE
jgi:hypothetical protein